jgi:hypothetical protein
MTADPYKPLLDRISELLSAGLKTEVEPFPETEKEFNDILIRLRALPPDDIEGKLVVAGFRDRHYGETNMRCLECMYYLINRKWCDLPELSLPVKADWYCRLWRI